LHGSAYYLARANHSGYQLAATISDFAVTASAAAPVQSVAGRAGAVTLTKADVGLPLADNTSDATKPVSAAQSTAISTAQATAISTASADATTKANAAQAASQPLDPDLTAIAALATTPSGRSLLTASALTAAGLSLTNGAALDVVGTKKIPTPGIVGHAARGNPLPRFFSFLKNFNPATGPVVEIVGLGSSVGNGATLPSPSTDAPLPYLVTQLSTYLNRVPIYTITGYNYSVNGTTVFDGVSTSYPIAVAAAHPGKVVLLIYGMNDGQSAQYNAGQTYTFAYQKMTALVRAIWAQGGDAIICTSPHPHTTRNGFSLGSSTPMSYPTSVAAPVSDSALIPSVANSTPNITWQGATIPISYRHYRVNEAFRQVAREMGVALIDAERYWFDAVAANGQDALFDAGEFVHPNLLGHQLSYQAAIADFVKGLFDTRSIETVSTTTTAQGGTGFTSYTIGDILYASAADTFATVTSTASGRSLLAASALTATGLGLTNGAALDTLAANGLSAPDGLVNNTSGPVAISVPDNSFGQLAIMAYQNAFGSSTWLVPYTKRAGNLAIGTPQKSIISSDPISTVTVSSNNISVAVFAGNTNVKYRIVGPTLWY
jgi:hypothetical protein